ncbi:Protein ect2 [Fasciola hepatica]|uniref:Protein ect2 n=1 Tax=Fasciola hepatica TaxID=6192 RepID=A0A4E0RB55_FASHE|nr:Protein ect2 [Fasciola hepatica]
MSSDRSPLIIIGTCAFSNESFSKLIGKLVEKFEVTYLPDSSTCISRVREANDHTKAGLSDPISGCEWFLFSDFDSFSDIHELVTLRPEARIMGYPAFVDCMLLQRKWTKPRPVFNFSMQGAVVCITGFRDRQTVNRLATMINWMGGSVRRYMNVNTTTHLVAYRCAGDKVREAAITTRRIATVKTSWVEVAWEKRCDNPHISATDSSFVEAHRAKVFQEICLAFVGFAPASDELQELYNLVLEHDGLITEDLNDKRLTHVVVTDSWPGHENILERLKQLMVREPSSASRSTLHSSRLPDSPSLTDEAQYRVCMLGLSYRVPVLRLEWFWLSLQLTCLCRLEPYLYVAGPSRNLNATVQLPPLARPSLVSADSEAPSDNGEILDNSFASIVATKTTSSPMPDEHETQISLTGCDEAIEEVDEPGPSPDCSPNKVTTAPVSTSFSEGHHSASVNEEKENLCPREAHSLASSGQTQTSLEFDLPGRKSAVHDGAAKLKSPLASSMDKVSFIVSPKHSNSPRGFISPIGDTRRSFGRISSHLRTGSSLSANSSQGNLLTQLADPLNFPSNRERRLCHISHQQLIQRDEQLQSPSGLTCTPSELDARGLSAELIATCWSPGSFNSALLLNATNASDCNTSCPPAQNRRSYGLGSLVGSLRDVNQKGSVDGTASETIPDLDASGTLKSPTTQVIGHHTQTSTPSSGKHKSTSRLSLLHNAARKSRTPASDLTSGGISNVSSSPQSDGLRGTPLRVCLEKRQHRVFEFFVTERNYVDIVRYLYRVAYQQVIDEDQPGGPILPRQEADYVFGKLGAIVELHERLQPQLDQLETNWSLTESRLGDVLHHDLLDEMDKAYGNYMQFYSPPHLHHLGEQFPRFLAFMRQVERRRESGRQSLAALLVRPVQRLPSVALLMEGIAKFTPKSHSDYAAVTRFSKGINDLLANINDRLRRNEERLSMLSLYHEIGGAPPEMLSSSRSLIARLNVFELGTNTSGNTTCEPVTLFLLTDCLEVARPRKRHTGEPLAHAMRAALAAVQGDGVDHLNQGDRDQMVAAGDTSGINLQASNPASNIASAGTNVDITGSGTTGGGHVTVTRTGSGASGTSAMNLGLMEGKQRCCFKHLYLLKLHEIKRVINFDTASLDRAAFGLVVRASSEEDDRVYAYCLAASFAASAAVAAGRCPEPVESAVAAATAACSRSDPVGAPSNGTTIMVPSSVCSVMNVNTTTNSNNHNVSNPNIHVATLQACVDEAKRVFLNKLCHHIIQVSCLAQSPDELLVDVEPEELLGFDLEQVFNATAVSLKSKKFGRQLTRNISIKTSRRLIVSAKRGNGPPGTPSHGVNNQWSQLPSDSRMGESTVSLITSPRRSVLGSLLGNRGQTVDTATFAAPTQPHELSRHASTPLRETRPGRNTCPPPTPTADQVAMAMLNLIRPSRSSDRIRCRAGVRAVGDDKADEDDIETSSISAYAQRLPFEDYTDDDPDLDCASVTSGNFGGRRAWPAFAKQSTTIDLDNARHTMSRLNGMDALSSASSLQSNTLDLTARNPATDSLTSLRSLRNATTSRSSLSHARGFLFGRSSVLTPNSRSRAEQRFEQIGGQRKSVCQSVLAGLKNFRRSIAGAGNALLHGSTAGSPFVTRTGRGPSRTVNPSNLAVAPALLNRSASVDAGPGVLLTEAAAASLTSGPCEIRLSGHSLNRPPAAPLAETEFERDIDGDSPSHLHLPFPLSATQSFCSAVKSVPPAVIGTTPLRGSVGASPHIHQVFPRSLTATVGHQGTVLTSSGSLRNLFQSAFRNQSSTSSRTANNRMEILKVIDSEAPSEANDGVAPSASLCEPGLDEDLQLVHLGSSMLSLTSWDSVSTLNYPVRNKPVDRILNRTLFSASGRKSGTGSAVWETASHLGVSTHEDMRRSFRLPVRRHLVGLTGGDSGSRKLQKKTKKYKLGAMSHLFQRPSVARGPNEAEETIGEAPLLGPSQSRPSTSRRESLLRGLFSR